MNCVKTSDDRIARACVTCRGTGYNNHTEELCPSCNGSGIASIVATQKAYEEEIVKLKKRLDIEIKNRDFARQCEAKKDNKIEELSIELAEWKKTSELHQDTISRLTEDLDSMKKAYDILNKRHIALKLEHEEEITNIERHSIIEYLNKE